MDATSIAGGIDAWDDFVSRATVGQGMYLVEGDETIEEVLGLSYGLEEGSRRFYRELADRSAEPEAKRLFEVLHNEEVRHEERLWERYRDLPGVGGDRRKFEDIVVPRSLEGGMTPDKVLTMHPEAGKGFAPALDLAMALEVDALDLYLRLAAAFENRKIKSTFFDLAEEEREHLGKLGKLRGQRP